MWQIREKIIERVIPNLRDVRDNVTCRVPEDAGGVIDVRAAWMYTKLDQDFLDYVYGEGKVSIPPLVAGKRQTIIPVSTDGGGGGK